MNRHLKVRFFQICVLATMLAIFSLPALAQAQSGDASGRAGSLVIEDVSGHTTDVARQQGKVVFINFWSLTCVPCKAEMPTINNFKEHYAANSSLLVYAIDLDHNFTSDKQYFSRKGFTLGVCGPAGVVPKTLFKGVLPTTAIIDKTGRVVFLHEGADKYDKPAFYHLVDSLLAQ